MIKKSFLLLYACILSVPGSFGSQPAALLLPSQSHHEKNQAIETIVPSLETKRSYQQVWDKLTSQKHSKRLAKLASGISVFVLLVCNIRNKSVAQKEATKIEKSSYIKQPLNVANALSVYPIQAAAQMDDYSCGYHALYSTNVLMDGLSLDGNHVTKKEKATDPLFQKLNNKADIQKVFGASRSPWKSITAHPVRDIIKTFRQNAYVTTCVLLGLDHKIPFQEQNDEAKKVIKEYHKAQELPLPLDPGDESDLSPQFKRSVEICSSALLYGNQIEDIIKICKTYQGKIAAKDENHMPFQGLTIPKECQISPNHHMVVFDFLPGQINPVTDQPCMVNSTVLAKIESLKTPGLHGIILRTDSTGDVSHWISIVINRHKNRVDYVVADSLNNVEYANTQLKRLVRLIEGEATYAKYEAKLSEKPSFFYTITHLL